MLASISVSDVVEMWVCIHRTFGASNSIGEITGRYCRNKVAPGCGVRGFGIKYEEAARKNAFVTS